MSVFRNINVVISADAQPLIRAYAAASAETRAFAESATAAGASLRSVNTATDGAATRLRSVSTAAAAAAANLQRLSTSAAAAAANVERLTAATTGASAETRAFVTEMGLAASETAALRTAATQTTTRLTAMAAASTEAAAATGALDAAALAAAEGTTALGAGSAAAAAGASAITRSAAAGAAATGVLGTTAADAERVAGRLAGTAGLAGAQLGTLGGQATSAAASAARLGNSMQLVGGIAAAALAIGLVAAIDAAIKFDAAMHNVASIDATVAANMATTEQQVLNLSKTLPQSAQTLAEGLYNISSSGFYGADALNILSVSAKAATAGLTTTNTASKAIVATMNAYGPSTVSAARASDALFATVNYGVISFEALTSAIANTVGTASQAGVGIEQVGTALATMTRSGLSASNAGISLNNLLAKMLKPSEALSAEFAKLGITQADLKDTGIGLYGVMMKLADSGDANVKSLLAWFPEIRAARGAMALLANDGQTYTTIFGEMGNATLTAGSTQLVFTEQMKSTHAELDVLKNKIAATGIEIGAALLPGLNQGIAGLTTFLGEVRDAGSEILNAAAPGFRDLAQSLVNLAVAAHNAGLDRLAADLSRLALGVQIVAFNALAAAVSAATGFLRDHQVAAAALAATFVAMNIGSIVALFIRLGAAISALGVRALFNGIVPLGIALAEMRTNLAAAAVSAGVFGAAVATLTIAFIGFANAGKSAKESINEITTSMDTTSVASMTAALKELQTERQKIADNNPLSLDKASTWDPFELFGQTKVQDQKKSLSELDSAITKVQGNIRTLGDSAATLGREFGLSADAVEQFAKSAGIDLSQGLDAVTSSGTTVRSAMETLLAPLMSAKLSTSDLGTVMKALSTDAGDAQAALTELQTVFDTLSGKSIDAKTALNNWVIALQQLASGESLATNATGQHTASLDANTVSGLTNSNMLLALMKQAAATATAVYNGEVATSGVDQATTDYNATLTTALGQLRAAAIASGISGAQFDALAGSVDLAATNTGTLNNALGQLPAGGVAVPVTTPGLPQASEDMDALNGTISRLPLYARIDTSTPGALEAMRDMDALNGIISRVPAMASTNVTTPGATQSWADMDALNGIISRQPAASQTAVTTPGATQSASDMDALNGIISRQPPASVTDVSTPGATQSTSDVGALNSTLGATPGAVASQVSAPGAEAATAAVNALNAALGGVHDVSATVSVYHMDYYQTIQALGTTNKQNALTAQGKAAGGQIHGPGGPRDDRAGLFALSAGEWVIQAAAAAKYGPYTMAAINAGVATVAPAPAAGFALGGQVSSAPVFPPGMAYGGMVSGRSGGGSVVVNAPISITANGAQASPAAIGGEVEAALGRVVSRVLAGAGRGRG